MDEEEGKSKNKMETTLINGFSLVPSTPVFWKSRKRSASMKNINKEVDDSGKNIEIQETPITETEKQEQLNEETMTEANLTPILSERRKALFEPLEPIFNVNGKRPSAESLLPPPDFDEATYPRGWLVGKKRKLVNVDVVESMRRIAVQEMNRKDREIDGLNEQLEEDSRCLEHLQIQLLEERSKRADVERQNTMLQNQVSMLMDMMQNDNDNLDDDEDDAAEP
jgi:hypothetical protein